MQIKSNEALIPSNLSTYVSEASCFPWSNVTQLMLSLKPNRQNNRHNFYNRLSHLAKS